MTRRVGVEDLESPFLLEALQPAPSAPDLIGQLSKMARRLSRTGRRHVEHALVRQLADAGERDPEALASAVTSLRRSLADLAGAEAEALEVVEEELSSRPTCECGSCHETGESVGATEAQEGEALEGEDESFEAEDANETDEEHEATGVGEASEADEATPEWDVTPSFEEESAPDQDLEALEGQGEDVEHEASPFLAEEAIENLAGGNELFENEVADEAEDAPEPSEADDAFETEDEAPYWTHERENADESWFSEEVTPKVEGEVKMSDGEFGDALAWFAKAAAVPDAVYWLLKQSPAFRSIVATLDAKTLHLNRPGGPPDDWARKFAPDAEGVFTKGPHVGRRMIDVKPSVEGSFFRPVGSPDGLLAADVLHLQAPTGRTGLDERGAWLERIVHESIHAARHVLGLRRAGTTAARRIRSAIDDEIETRKEEGRIVGDLRRRFPNFGAYQPTTGLQDAWAVERDAFPGKLRLTYLETFVLGEHLESARQKLRDTFVPNKRARTAEEEIDAFDKFVDRIPLEKRPLASYLTANPAFIRPDRDKLAIFQAEYPTVRLIRRILDARWRSVRIHSRDPYREPQLEKMRQEHARTFFGGLAAYTSVP